MLQVTGLWPTRCIQWVESQPSPHSIQLVPEILSKFTVRASLLACFQFILSAVSCKWKAAAEKEQQWHHVETFDFMLIFDMIFIWYFFENDENLLWNGIKRDWSKCMKMQLLDLSVKLLPCGHAKRALSLYLVAAELDGDCHPERSLAAQPAPSWCHLENVADCPRLCIQRAAIDVQQNLKTHAYYSVANTMSAVLHSISH